MAHDPDGTRLPIKLDTTTNGEFAPIPLEPVHRQARATALRLRPGMRKRLAMLGARSWSPPAVPLRPCSAMNRAYAARGPRGSFFDVPAEAALDVQLARSTLDTGEFIFDVQGHFVNPTGAWTTLLPPAPSR